MTFGELKEKATFKLVNKVSGQVEENCPEYYKIRPFYWMKNKLVNAASDRPNKTPAYWFFEDNHVVVP